MASKALWHQSGASGCERHSSLFIPPEKIAGRANPWTASSADPAANFAINPEGEPDGMTSHQLMQMERLNGDAGMAAI